MRESMPTFTRCLANGDPFSMFLGVGQHFASSLIKPNSPRDSRPRRPLSRINIAVAGVTQLRYVGSDNVAAGFVEFSSSLHGIDGGVVFAFYRRDSFRLSTRSVGLRIAPLAQAGSEPEIAQAGMVVRPPAQRPVELPLVLGNRKIVDAGVPDPVETVRIKLPVLIAVGTKPVA